MFVRRGLATLVIAGLLVACGGDDDADSPTTTRAAAAPATTPAPSRPETTEPAGSEPAATEPAGPETTAADGAPGEADLDALIAAAQDEGNLTFYTFMESSRPVAEAFTERYGIDVEFVQLNSSDMANRFVTEAESGSTPADVLMPSDVSFMQQMIEDGYLLGLSESDVPGYDAYPEVWKNPFVDSVTISVVPNGMAYNTDEFSEDEAPKSYADLADPRFAGRLMIPNPRDAYVYLRYFNVLYDTYGEETLRAIADNIQQAFPGAVAMLASVGAGEGGVALFASYGASLRAIADGAPLRIVPPVYESNGVEQREFVLGGEGLVIIAKDAPHPNAARLFTAYLMSAEGQAVFNTDGYLSPLVHADELQTFERVPQQIDPEREALLFEILGL